MLTPEQLADLREKAQATTCPDLLKRWGCHAVTVSDWREAARMAVDPAEKEAR